MLPLNFSLRGALRSALQHLAQIALAAFGVALILMQWETANSDKTNGGTTVKKQTDADVRLANTRTVDALQRVYAMVIALALTTGVNVLIQTLGIVKDGRDTGSSLSTAMLFAAFLSTLIAFYHGMNRHLDDTFVIGDHTSPDRLPLLFDIIIFLVEGGLLVVMASTIDNPRTFLLAWTTLLAIDVVWGLIVYVLVRRTTPAKWVVNNAVFIACAWLSWAYVFRESTIAIALIEILRSAADYRLNWRFYFPNATRAR